MTPKKIAINGKFRLKREHGRVMAAPYPINRLLHARKLVHTGVQQTALMH
jgi:hypothetical protein